MGEHPDFRQRTRVFATHVLTFTSRGIAQRHGRFVCDQLRASACSVGANAEEAKGAQSKRDFLAKMSIALKEAREALYWLRVVEEATGNGDPELSRLTDEANQLVAILTATVKTTRMRLEDEAEQANRSARRPRRR